MIAEKREENPRNPHQFNEEKVNKEFLSEESTIRCTVGLRLKPGLTIAWALAAAAAAATGLLHTAGCGAATDFHVEGPAP